MTADSIFHPASLALIVSGIALCGWLAFTESDKMGERNSLFRTVERTVDGVVYEVKVRKDAPTFVADGSAYAF